MPVISTHYHEPMNTLHRTATLVFTEASLYDAAGKLCAHATGTFKLMPRLATGPGSAQPLNRISTD